MSEKSKGQLVHAPKGRKMAKSDAMITYREEGSGKEWQVRVGEPNGTFSLPGDTSGEVYSVASLHEMIKKFCKKVKVVTGKEISGGDYATAEDALQLTGSAPNPRKTVPQKGARSENRIMVMTALKNYGKEGATKKALMADTSLTMATVTGIVSNDPEIELAGKDGTQNKYRLKK